MKQTTLNILLVLTMIVTIVSCEIDISVDLPRPEDKIVVEGYIQNGVAPMVFLTKNSGYFDVVNAESLVNMLVYSDTVRVTVSNGLNSKELEMTILPQFPYLGYSCEGFVGEVGQEYRLDIYYGSKHYFAYTTIPEPVTIDSVWFTLLKDRDSLGVLSFRYNDPPEPRNYYALHTRVEGEQQAYYKPYYGSHIDDDLFDNGAVVVYGGVTRGTDMNSFFYEELEDEEWLNSVAFGKETTVDIRLSSIDSDHYQFWNSYYRHMITWGNPFTNPATVKTNIQGDPGLGVWGGYGTNIVRAYITDSATIEILP